MKIFGCAALLALSAGMGGTAGARVQTSTPPPSPHATQIPAPTTPQGQSAPQAPQKDATPAADVPGANPTHGTVLFQSHGEPPAAAEEPVDSRRKVLPKPDSEDTQARAGDGAPGPELSDRERGALLFTAYDLDARITPAGSRLTMRAKLTVRNRSDAPLARIALQISSSLSWESVSLVASSVTQRLALAQHLIDTDTDHTGQAREAVLELPEALAPGAMLTLDTFYSGTVAPSAERLSRIGASEAQGAMADWDAIEPAGVALRGFGNVLWYPVASPQLFLGDGTRLFEAMDAAKLADQAATVRLRLSVEYIGDAPAAAYFCGRRAAFTAASDSPAAADEPAARANGVATAEFATEPLGFRAPSLFVIARPEILTAPLGGELAVVTPMLAAASADATGEAAIPALASATERLAPLLQQWLGARPLSTLTVIDHPGQPFADGPLLVAPITGLTTSGAEPGLTASLAHAWVQTGRPWVDEGLAQFFALLQIEQTHGREAMVAQLGELMKPLEVAPMSLTQTTETVQARASREPLMAAGSELIYRRKAAAVWLMLREMVGDQALQITLASWRTRPPARTTAEQEALVLEALLEKNSGKDLHRFFDDWVLHDRGLPELTVAEVSPRKLPTTEKGQSGGWLTAVTVHNAGEAMAEVPVIVSSGSFSTTVRLLVPGLGNATARVQAESAPTAVQVNDGITPEARTSVHRREVRSR